MVTAMTLLPNPANANCKNNMLQVEFNQIYM